MPDARFYQTQRLALRPPCRDDLTQIFERIASDAVVTRFVSWPKHTTIKDTEAFLAFSDAEWSRWPAGPLLITSRKDGGLLGSTGLAFETAHRASTGFVLARAAWGAGIATEALAAMLSIAAVAGVRRLYALCHVQHERSVRVLERCGFVREGTLRQHTVFPNLEMTAPQDVFCYAQILSPPSENRPQ